MFFMNLLIEENGFKVIPKLFWELLFFNLVHQRTVDTWQNSSVSGVTLDPATISRMPKKCQEDTVGWTSPGGRSGAAQCILNHRVTR